MAIITYYIVERKGVEVLKTVDRKEADKYDRMLDISDELMQLIEDAPLNKKIDENELEELCIHLAKNKEMVSKILRGQKLEKILKEDDIDEQK